MLEKDTILYVITKSTDHLKKLGIQSSRLDAELLLSHVLQIPRIKLYSNFDKKLTEDQKDEYRSLIKERSTFKPIAYILSKKNFYNLEFFVDNSVLIPRPETEELVEWILNNHSENSSKSVLDLCSGSGCIGISIAHERNSWMISFSDISSNSLQVCKINCYKLLPQREVFYYESNLFQNIVNDKFDIIVCNPPYIPESEKKNISKDVLDFEPSLALFNNHPEEFLRNLFEGSKKVSKENTLIYMEIHPDWKDLLEALVIDCKLKNIEFKKDLSNKLRMVKIII
jgi:release factor glutamine methyltransferase